MAIIYKTASLEDLDVLVKTRIDILKVINHLDDTADMSLFEKEVRDYYIKSMTDDTHIAYLVYDDDKFIGAGGVSFYQIMPSFHNPKGWTAFIMNIYTDPDYRGRGIATTVLDMIVKASKARGIDDITLDTTKMGRPVYEKYGFKDIVDLMNLPQH